MDIGDFIALDNPERATSFIAEIEARIREAAERPDSFPARHDLHKGLRAARHGRYLIFFLAEPDAVQPDTVKIVRVLHGSRDLSRALGA